MKRSRPNPYGKVRKRRGSAQPDAMKEFLPNDAAQCWHCGLLIANPDGPNAAHIYPKSRHPELVGDPDNFHLLCSHKDIQRGRRHLGRHIEPCHYIFDNGTAEQWEEKRDLFFDMGRDLPFKPEPLHLKQSDNGKENKSGSQTKHDGYGSIGEEELRNDLPF